MRFLVTGATGNVGARWLGISRSKHLILTVRRNRMPAMHKMLMLSDREEISRGLAEGLLYSEIELRWVVIRR